MSCDTPFYVMPLAGLEKVPVPCGRCPPCKIRRVNGWVFRLLEEEKRSSNAHFVTLTYDTTHVPISEHGFMTLQKRDFQLYMKRLRKLCPATLKYYAVGEYGSANNRPHYHAIIFNVHDSVLFHDAWMLGAVHIGKVSGDSIAYTMKYIDKQSTKKLHVRDDRNREFSLMSKGLGENYLTPETIDYHQQDISRLYLMRHGGHKIALPRYYRNKIYDEPVLKQQARNAQTISEKSDADDRRDFELRYAGSGYTYEQYLSSSRYGRHRNFYSTIKKRNL